MLRIGASAVIRTSSGLVKCFVVRFARLSNSAHRQVTVISKQGPIIKRHKRQSHEVWPLAGE